MKRSKGQFLLLTVLVLCAALSITAQTETCELRVGVYEFKHGNSEKFPIRGAKLSLERVDTTERASGVYDRGTVVFRNLSAGDFDLVVRKEGFKTTVERVNIDCLSTGENRAQTELVFLWRGSPETRFEVRNRVVRIGGLSTDHFLRQIARPVYSAVASKVNASGKVEVEVEVNELGYVVSATAISGHPLLTGSAVKAAKESKFWMTIIDGIPVRVTRVLVYNFVP